MIYGLIFTLIGIILGPNKLNIIRVFIHLYLPSLLYFISRKYTVFSIINILKMAKIVWIISILFTIDVLIEYYFINIKDSYMMIPWVMEAMKEYTRGISDVSVLKYHNMFFNPIMLSSILTSGKGAGVTVAICFSFLYPFAFLKRNNTYIESRPFNNIITFVLPVLLMLVTCSILLPNFSATISIFFISIYIGVYKKNITKTIFLIVSFSLVLVLSGLGETLINIYTSKVVTLNVASGRTGLDSTIDIKPLLQYYTSDPFAIIFGKIIFADLYNIPRAGELGLLLYPINYGLTWFLIIISIVFQSIKYCNRLIKYIPKSKVENILGLSFLGVIIVCIMSNLHYPHFDDHGIVELLFIMLGVLSSLYEMKFNKRQA